MKSIHFDNHDAVAIDWQEANRIVGRHAGHDDPPAGEDYERALISGAAELGSAPAWLHSEYVRAHADDDGWVIVGPPADGDARRQLVSAISELRRAADRAMPGGSKQVSAHSIMSLGFIPAEEEFHGFVYPAHGSDGTVHWGCIGRPGQHIGLDRTQAVAGIVMLAAEHYGVDIQHAVYVFRAAASQLRVYAGADIGAERRPTPARVSEYHRAR